MVTPDLYVQIHTSAHLPHFRASFGHQKPFKIELEVLYRKLYEKICNNFTDTNDMAMKLCWLTDMTKMNIYLWN